ncbi:unnamed protein product [Diamesa serratosioi]
MLTDPKVFNSKLISLVENYPEIYNNKLKGYKERLGKDKSWISISKKLDNAPIARVKKRWRSLRTEFVRNYKNSRPQRYGNAMNFILPFIGKSPRQQIILNQEQEQEEQEEAESDDNTVMILDDDFKYQNITSFQSDPIIKITQLPIDDPTIEITQLPIDDPTIDFFFQAMAATLKTLPKQTQAQVKAEVFQIISKAEIAFFSNR